MVLQELIGTKAMKDFGLRKKIISLDASLTFFVNMPTFLSLDWNQNIRTFKLISVGRKLLGCPRGEAIS